MFWNDKTNVLIISNRSLSSKYVFHTICDIGYSIYKELKEKNNVFFMTQYADEKRIYKLFSKENRNIFFDEVFSLDKFVSNLDYAKALDWEEIYDSIDVSSLPKFERVIEIGSGISEGAFLKSGKMNYEKLFKSTAQFKYLSVRKIKEVVMFSIKVARHNDLKIEHHIIDPQELNYNDIGVESERYFPYTSESQNFERNDAFLNYYKQLNVDSDKDFDFVFGYTILTKDRVNNMYDVLTEKLKDFNIKMFLRDKYNNVDTFVNKDVYLELIRRSKFTLIIPAYDKSTFSAFRYIESVYNNCVPLILDTNDLREVKKSMFIPNELIVSIDNIDKAIKRLNYKEILEQIKEKI